MPVMKAIIKITGLAYCHLANVQPNGIGDLQVLFLHADKRHKLKLCITKEKPGQIFKINHDIPEDTSMVMIPTNAVSVPGADPSEIVNIDKLHSPNFPAPAVHLPLKRSASAPQMKLSYLSIPRVLCYAAKKSLKNYEFWEIRPGYKVRKNDPPHQPQQIVTELGVAFDVGEHGELKLQLSKQLETSYEFEYESSCQYEIKFDNNCPDDACVSDFRYYYQILDGGGVEFEELLPFPSFSDQEESDVEAACNPVKGDPPNCTPEQFFLNNCPPG